MSRNTAERSRYKKYDYKMHHTSLTQRSESLPNTDSSCRKTSAFKIRKESTENSLPFEDIRLPLGEIFENSAKVARALIDRKDTRSLKQRNGQLEQQVARQALEMRELREALAGMKEIMGVHRHSEGQQLKEANLVLQTRCEAQDREMASLRREVEQLKAMAEQGVFENSSTGQMEESQISRRAQYARNYEQATDSIPKQICQQCVSLAQLTEQLRLQFEGELLRLDRDRQIQQTRLADLESQVQHKNKCIDYLRSQVEQYQRSSKKQARGHYVRSKPDEAFNSFSEFKY